MYVRRTKTRNSICFQIGRKRQKRFELIEHIGCTQDKDKVEILKLKAQERLRQLKFENQLSLLPKRKLLKATLIKWRVTGYHQVFGKVYDSISFPDNLLRDLVVARIVYPKSKLATLAYLKQNLGIKVGKNRLYKFLDTLDPHKFKKTAYEFVTGKQRGKSINLLFYDVTTLYFESDRQDELRQKGYSKDHRHDMPQILIGLCVDIYGYPFDFSYFEGKTFEGHTLGRTINSLKQKYSLDHLTIVADSGMLSKENLNFLKEKKIGYIVGARLKNLPESLKILIINHDYGRKPVFETTYQGKSLIVNYSEKRAKKDKANRKRIIDRLIQRLNKKQTVIRKSKYLKTRGKNKVVGIDESKIREDAQYDGLKGYLTNTRGYLSAKQVIENYHSLWKVEKAFRMSKHDLHTRPVYHSKPQRIRSHLLLCFVSLLVMKEAEMILNKKGYSLKKAIELLSRVGEGKIRIGKITIPLEPELNPETRKLLKLFTK